MAPNGLAAWLIPSEFMDVNYGQEIKDYLLNRVTLIRVHRFDPLDLQFDDAFVSNSVLWFKKSSPPKHHLIQFTFGGSIASPNLVESISARNLTPSAKWSKISSRVYNQPSLNTLSDLFNIKRGIATGANQFFILAPKTIAEFEIPSDVLVPILPGPRYLTNNEIPADETGNPIIHKPLFLLSCRKPIEEIKSLYPSVWEYLQKGIKAGIHEHYLCQHRSPWYAQETRKPTKFLCTYMGRQLTKSSRPFRFIYNESTAIAPNVYLMMYPKSDLAKILSSQPKVARLLWTKLNTIPIADIIRESRVYGDGLHKLEPKELANVSADTLREIIPIISHSPVPYQMPMKID
jgi:adenine-specific DNA-methyltransferase